MAVPNDAFIASSFEWSRKDSILSDVVNSMRTIIMTEVVHTGIGSVIHNAAAKRKMAMTRCSMMVNPGMPNVSVGTNQVTSAKMTGTRSVMSFLVSI